MNCPACGRALAAGAKKCVFCGDGTKYKQREQLAVPKGTTQHVKSSGFPWGKVFFLLLIIGAVAACFMVPELNAKIRELISKF